MYEYGKDFTEQDMADFLLKAREKYRYLVSCVTETEEEDAILSEDGQESEKLFDNGPSFRYNR